MSKLFADRERYQDAAQTAWTLDRKGARAWHLPGSLPRCGKGR